MRHGQIPFAQRVDPGSLLHDSGGAVPGSRRNGHGTLKQLQPGTQQIYLKRAAWSRGCWGLGLVPWSCLQGLPVKNEVRPSYILQPNSRWRSGDNNSSKWEGCNYRHNSNGEGSLYIVQEGKPMM